MLQCHWNLKNCGQNRPETKRGIMGRSILEMILQITMMSHERSGVYPYFDCFCSSLLRLARKKHQSSALQALCEGKLPVTDDSSLKGPVFALRDGVRFFLWIQLYLLFVCMWFVWRIIIIIIRLLHSPSLVAIGLSVGLRNMTSNWLASNFLWLVGLNIDCDCLIALLHYGLTLPVGISTVFQTPVTVPLHGRNGGQMPAVRTVQGDCKSV